MKLDVIPYDGKPIRAPGIYARVPMEIYHSADLCVGPSVSSSALRTVFTQSPMDYWIYSPMNPRRVEKPESEAFVLGRAAHHLLLGEAEFGRHFLIRPEELNGKAWNGNRTECREWLASAAEARLTVLTPNQIEQIRGMAGLLPWQEGLDDSGLANSAVVRAGALNGLIEHTIIGYDDETGLWLKSRPDVIPLDSLMFSDFKTSAEATDEAVRRTLDEYRYDMQADLASVCLEHAADVRFEAFGFIFGAKKPPHAVNVIELDPADLEEAAKDNRTALRTVAQCLDTGKWPGPAGRKGDATFIRRSDWSRARAVSRREFLELELVA